MTLYEVCFRILTCPVQEIILCRRKNTYQDTFT
jgi:hypothetical protein